MIYNLIRDPLVKLWHDKKKLDTRSRKVTLKEVKGVTRGRTNNRGGTRVYRDILAMFLIVAPLFVLIKFACLM